MQHQVISRGADRPRFGQRPHRLSWSDAAPLLLVLLAALLIVAVNPLGYRGGGADDWHYMSAARCAAEQGFCLPPDHWWRRFPLVIPAGRAIAWFGEGNFGLWVVPLIYGVGAISLFVLMIQRQFGRLEALLAGLVLVATPVFSERLLEINVDTAEFAFVLAAAFFVERGYRKGSAIWILPAGAMLALAVQARPTSLALVPIFLMGLAIVPALRRSIGAFAAGMAIPIGCEALVYAIWTGDALLPWKLSMAHTRIPTSELDASVDLSQSPLFNVAYIDGWVPSVGIEAHWSVEGLVNLLAHPGIGLSLICGLLFIALHRQKLGTQLGGGKLMLFLIGGAMLFFGALVYGLAVDPKPRMFLPVAAVASVCFGVFAARSWREGSRALVLVCLALLLGKAAMASYNRLDLQGAGALARVWIAQEPADTLAADDLTSRFLTLSPEVRALPVHPDGDRRRVLVVSPGPCTDLTKSGDYRRWPILRSHRFDRAEPQLIRMLRERNLFMNARLAPSLCLLGRPAER
ncbi:MAG TPA: glycosyltransferase family 39 protein [Allosphingosinicella sp.]|jgi:4-amino-4-deoxy-L-arabinose transferase-like glycosyltransferase|uniref:glycosyltransferase family 39 protein n=1 Tax=Allosphingosinicella sp. TaxID=2823234 RepID=UPI002F2880AE